MWAAKEAALKRAGVGLRADLRAHSSHGRRTRRRHGGGPHGRFGIRFFDIAGKVLAVSSRRSTPTFGHRPPRA